MKPKSDSSNSTLRTYQKGRTQLLEKLTMALKADARVAAAWLWGSLGRGNGDALSDLDLWVVVGDADAQAVIAERQDFVRRFWQTLFVLEGPRNAPDNGAYLMSIYQGSIAPYQVDWYWQPLSEASVPPGTRVLFDKAGLPSADAPYAFSGKSDVPNPTPELEHQIHFFWIMLMIAAKYTYREPYAEEMDMLLIVLHAFEATYHMCGKSPVIVYSDQQPTPEAKLNTLYALANQLKKILDQCEGSTIENLAESERAVDRYLKLIREVLADR